MYIAGLFNRDLGRGISGRDYQGKGKNKRPYKILESVFPKGKETGFIRVIHYRSSKIVFFATPGKDTNEFPLNTIADIRNLLTISDDCISVILECFNRESITPIKVDFPALMAKLSAKREEEHKDGIFSKEINSRGRCKDGV